MVSRNGAENIFTTLSEYERARARLRNLSIRNYTLTHHRFMTVVEILRNSTSTYATTGNATHAEHVHKYCFFIAKPRVL